MSVGVLMPKAGISVESCVITQWLKKPGDRVNLGDVLFAYETDKASFEHESPESGELLEIFYEEGDEVPVLVNVCALGTAGDDVSHLRQSGTADMPPPQAPSSAQPAPAIAPATDTGTTAAPAVSGGEVKISPRARRLANEKGVDFAQANPSGPYGRVIERDIRGMLENGTGVMTSAAYSAAAGTGTYSGTGIGGKVGVGDLSAPLAASSPATAPEADAPAYEDVAFNGIRRAISKSMTISLSTIPQLTHSFSFDATEMMAYREKLKKHIESMELAGITFNDMILYAVSRLLPKYPLLNAHMLDANTIRKFRHVHLGMAVDTERGLMVPVIQYADRKSLSQISMEAKALAGQAQQGTLNPDLMQGGTFSVSNLGTLQVESFTPVINPPQTGILGVCNITQRVRVVAGEIRAYPAMGISLTYDHRAIDGAPASRFAAELCRALESFTLLLAQ